MRALHIVKTSNGATWAALEAAELARQGVELHVAVPFGEGGAIRLWREAGARIHVADLDFPTSRPWRLPRVHARARALAAAVKPDIIHLHHFGPAMVVRQALGKRHPAPRVFQVPGPLHLEHRLYRDWDLACAGERDYWMASSRCIRDLYLRAGAPAARLFLSYYGIRTAGFPTARTHQLRERLGISPHTFVAGNISYIYSPKYYLGQFAGLKRHEDLIAALGIVLRQHSDTIGLLIGGPWGNATRYRDRLRRMADRVGQGRILMPGALPADEVREFWPDFDCAIHAPISENCGGVVEPMLAGVPTIAGDIGGLPEVVMEGVTGSLVPTRSPAALAGAMLKIIGDRSHYRELARRGGRFVGEMFDVRRTASEVLQAYRHILDPSIPAPVDFDARAILAAETLDCMHT